MFTFLFPPLSIRFLMNLAQEQCWFVSVEKIQMFDIRGSIDIDVLCYAVFCHPYPKYQSYE
jgi:hypothetical protein